MPPSCMFCYVQALILLNSLIQILILSGTPRQLYPETISNQLSGHPVWPVKLTLTLTITVTLLITCYFIISYFLIELNHYLNKSCFYVYCLPPHQLCECKNLFELFTTLSQVSRAVLSKEQVFTNIGYITRLIFKISTFDSIIH